MNFICVTMDLVASLCAIVGTSAAATGDRLVAVCLYIAAFLIFLSAALFGASA